MTEKRLTRHFWKTVAVLSLAIHLATASCQVRDMTKNPPAVLRSALYALRGGFLIRPFVIAFLVGTAGAVLSAIEERYPAIQAVVPWTLFPSHGDHQVAQAILTTIATATMTVVSIVFAILLMTLTLASTQFSLRILISFVRDQVTQWTLGIFLGTLRIASRPYPPRAPFLPLSSRS
jgi:uncharacterized membrane protein